MSLRDKRGIEFRVLERERGGPQVVPFVDGESLADLVSSYQREHHLSPAGGYAGIVPENFKLGDLREYLRGQAPNQFPDHGRAWLLWCDCAEAGCWPLESRVTTTRNAVVWSDFESPHRRNWSYRGFGPFVFSSADYDAATEAAVVALEKVRWRGHL